MSDPDIEANNIAGRRADEGSRNNQTQTLPGADSSEDLDADPSTDAVKTCMSCARGSGAPTE